MRRMRWVVLLLAMALTAAEAAPPSPTDFVQSVVTDAQSILSDGRLTPAARAERLAALLARDLDLKAIARFALGHYWRTAGADERAQFLRLFPRWAVQRAAARLARYRDAAIAITGSRRHGTESVVASTITPRAGKPLRVAWHVVGHGGHVRIADIDVAGVSLLLAARAAVTSALERDGGNLATLDRDLAAGLRQAAVPAQ